jgi:hypothetical protein
MSSASPFNTSIHLLSLVFKDSWQAFELRYFFQSPLRDKTARFSIPANYWDAFLPFHVFSNFFNKFLCLCQLCFF